MSEKMIWFCFMRFSMYFTISLPLTLLSWFYGFSMETPNSETIFPFLYLLNFFIFSTMIVDVAIINSDRKR